MSLSLRRVLVGIAVGILLALLIAPQTRWLVRQQVLISIGRYHLLPGQSNSYTTSYAEDCRRRDAVSASAPDDFGLHYAAVEGGSHAAETAGMRALASQFPNQPALYANILRYDTLGAVRLNRPESGLLTGTKPSPTDYHPKPLTPAALAAFDQTAAEGERTDPDNAYFPLMRAVGLLAAHRDADAEAAVRRAGTKTVWCEYTVNDVQSRWRLHQAAFGDKGAIPQVSAASNTLLPHYQQMRQMARVLIYRAMQKEQAGDVAGGLTLRESLRRCGDLMRVQSNFLIGAVIGSNLCNIACLRPGGAPPLPELPFQATEDQQNARRRSDALAFAAYARQHGRADLAASALAEADAGEQINAIMTYTDNAGNLITEPLFRLINWWTADVAVLANVFWLLALWAVVAVIYAGRWLTARVPERAVALGWSVLALTLVLSLCVTLFFLVLIAVNIIEPFAGEWGLGTLLLLLITLGLGLRHTLRHVSWASLRRDAGWALLGWGVLVFAVYGLWALLQWQTKGIWATWATQNYFLPWGTFRNTPYDYQRIVFQWTAIGLALAAPLLLTFGAALAARLRLARFSASLRVLAPATACVLLVVYGGLVLGTLRQEAVVRGPLEATVRGSGPYFAARAGLPWPGAVR